MVAGDETTGAGAYLISGGLNGGGLVDCVRELVPVLQQILLLILLSAFLLMFLSILLGSLGGLGALGGGAAAAFLLFALFVKGSTPLGEEPIMA